MAEKVGNLCGEVCRLLAREVLRSVVAARVLSRLFRQQSGLHLRSLSTVTEPVVGVRLGVACYFRRFFFLFFF